MSVERDRESTDGVVKTDALTERVNAWLSLALVKAKVVKLADSDHYSATLPPFRKFLGVSETESAALSNLRDHLEEFALRELVAGRDLPTWESKIPDVPEAARRLVRVSNLQHELKTRAKDWGGERQLLPAGAVERCLADIDAVVTRHAMQIQGAPPATVNREAKTAS